MDRGTPFVVVLSFGALPTAHGSEQQAVCVARALCFVRSVRSRCFSTRAWAKLACVGCYLDQNCRWSTGVAIRQTGYSTIRTSRRMCRMQPFYTYVEESKNIFWSVGVWCLAWSKTPNEPLLRSLLPPPLSWTATNNPESHHHPQICHQSSLGKFAVDVCLPLAYHT